MLCGLVNQPTAPALASVLMIHPMTFSPSLWYSPCLCDLTQLYKPRAVYHLGWGKWLNTGSRMRAQSSGWDHTRTATQCSQARQLSGLIHLRPWQKLVMGVDGILLTYGLLPLYFQLRIKSGEIPLWLLQGECNLLVPGAFSLQTKASLTSR